MKRLSKKWFKQIMIHITIKQELDSLKEIIRNEYNITHRISYADVILFLIRQYKNSLRKEYPLSPSLLVVNKLEKKNLRVSIPITPKPFRPSYKLDGKIRVSNSIKS